MLSAYDILNEQEFYIVDNDIKQAKEILDKNQLSSEDYKIAKEILSELRRQR